MSSPRAAEHPFRGGTLLALLSATLFGLSTPFLQRLGRDLGPFTTAAILYAGAALAMLFGRRTSEAPLRPRHAPRVIAVAVCGAVVAPACLAWGLSRTSAMLGSLLLATEALFTVVLARVIYHEPIGRRVLAALGLIGLGSALLVRRGAASETAVLGALAVVGAALAWGADNTFSRPLADLHPRHLVLAKSLAGSAMSFLLALGEPRPTAGAVLGLLVTGGLGYGTSLRLYVEAQRRIGAGRTGSIFATAPFLGAVAAGCFGEGTGSWAMLAGGTLVALGLYLHLAERHGHEHTHSDTEHEHTHSHDDGHHEHTHEPPVAGEHSHKHRHAPVRHTHPHTPDMHHQHEH